MSGYLLKNFFIMKNIDLFDAIHFWYLCEFRVNSWYLTALKYADTSIAPSLMELLPRTWRFEQPRILTFLSMLLLVY